ncbi:YkgJ family cysteine cluster protein [Pseudovibrio sp. Tun.PSC04-5.I4]|uniref:YkgJ family cysteine cluster protein n=1 Tax=Pseudovibrio sp. Tun.PSC04-5.I4 TaxID=1798213 RepID=UPI0008913637|nr:YkgJ family cysteine cluster protein [Pseudovibrio sp. Tun.PSC04-5.I4]SDR47873.1 Fe-S-cluster containining protein [Pseudovibrio sp. Tun.PSC04-5.I4]
MSVSQNPCLACNIGQDCCNRLTGLKVSEAEFQTHFQHHADRISVLKTGKIYEISALDEKPCPNWEEQCTVYDTRPVECRLFPHTIGQVVEKEHEVLLTVHSRTSCPLKADLRMSESDAVEMTREFGVNSYGSNTAIRVKRETGIAFLQALAHRAVKKLSN